jgi:hypothetical protein
MLVANESYGTSEVFERAHLKANMEENSINGFQTRIYPVNRGVFTDVDFTPATEKAAVQESIRRENQEL